MYDLIFARRILLNSPICELCGSQDIAHLFIKDNFNIVRCRQCSLYFVYPQESKENFEKRYSSADYFHTRFVEKFGYGNYAQCKYLGDLWFGRMLKEIEKYCPNKGKVLDVGCAFGYFLLQAKKSGWEIYGLEPSSYAVDYAHKNFSLDIQLGKLEENTYPDNYFQVITLFDVFEHFNSPIEALRQTHRLLEPSGLLYITTPNVSGFLRRLMGRFWFHFKPLEHTFFFSPSTIRQYLTKSNFEILSIKTSWRMVDLEFMINRAFHYNSPLPRIIQWLSGNNSLKNKTFPFPTGEIDVFARKK